ncbi:MAG TPA: hypothetical protein VLK24_04040 [Gaiellaceae bacterium]|nr:hypothetical protein [Gaiellaceae bacterium]
MRRIYLAGPPFAEEYRRRAGLRAGRPDAPRLPRQHGRPRGPDRGGRLEEIASHRLGKPVVVDTGGTPPHPWTVYVGTSVHAALEDAVAAVVR